MNESEKTSNAEKIIQKWSKLQKIIKEGVILKKVIIEQQKIDFAKLKKNFIEYYDTKLKIRKTYEDIQTLKNNNVIYKQIIFEKNVNYNDKLKSIAELLFLLRNNYDYIIKLTELIEANKENNDYIIYSFIELLCNQFYDNILIPNPEQEELLILIYKLIEKDINNYNNNLSCDNFMNKNFLVKFIKYLMRKTEIKNFLSKLLAPFILSIEEDCTDLDLSFYEFDNEENNKEEKEIFMDFIDKLKMKLNNDKEKNKDINNNDEKNFVNLFFEKILDKQSKSTLYKFWKDSISLLNILDNINENSQKNLIKLKSSFLFLKNKIDYLLQSLKEKISSMPYIIKCICKIIFLLISHKYSSSNNYIYNSFISKYFFENCIFLALKFEDDNLIDNRIYNSKTKQYLKTIADILSKIVNYNIFEEEKTPMQILLNYYFIEIIPVLDEIFKNLIEIRLPNFLNFLIGKKLNGDKYDYKYKYFKENKDEFIYLQSICISVEDILFLLEIIFKNKNEFKNLDNFKDFESIINNINKFYEKDILNIMLNPNKNIFFMLFNTKYKSKMSKVLKYYYKNRKSSTFKLPQLEEEKIKYKRFKLCLKKILKNLSDINNKSNIFINFATTNDKFLTALKYTLDNNENIENNNDKKIITT